MIFILFSILFGFMLSQLTILQSRRREKIRLIILIISLLSEITYFIIKVIFMDINILQALPIYWCAATNFVQIYALVTKNNFIIRIAFFMIIGPIVALLFENQGINYSIFYYFNHSLIITSIVFLVTSYYDMTKDIFVSKIRTFNVITIYFIIFEMIYPYFLSAYFDYSSIVQYMYIFDKDLLNVSFVIIFGSLFVFVYSYFIEDLLIKFLKNTTDIVFKLTRG